MDDIFNLDDYDNEISYNTKKPPSPEKDKGTEKQSNEIEEKKDIRDTNQNSLKNEEEISTKGNSNQKEIDKNENSQKTKKNTIISNIEDNEQAEDSENNEENSELDEEKEEENENEESEGEFQEKEDEPKEDFQERHKNMQNWAIEDELDISDFSKIENPPITFPFELDEFQKRSILRLEKHENVLVCAHTSSGKTVVAEYGIALGKKHSKRVLYTSPIKALSNQKFREFKRKFGDVGILTGDVSINPEAQCLIMTTEILQSALYKNSELLNQVEWIVFDEVHYINDNERGHVWEEILILLPRGIGIIMLSATIPNYMEFAQWVGDIKETKVYVQNTLKRVVPLQHLLFIDKNNVFKVKEKDNVNISKIQQAFNYLEIRPKNRNNTKLKNKEYEFIDNITYFDKFKKTQKKKENWRRKDYNNKYKNDYNYYNQRSNPKITKIHYKIEEIVDYLDNKDLCPAVIFVFSIKRITEYAKMLSLKNLASREQKKQISNFFRSVVNSMPEEDRIIPQVKELEEILKSGIGMHHAGLLPILKEAVEVLYSRGLIKILFATTSFSIGLNMPTRTVVFTDLYKFNDSSKVILSSSEYLQMCGRAGRRGIDQIGNVYILLTELSNKNEKDEIIGMLEGKGDNVASKFRLCYRTLLSFFSRNIKDMNQFFKESFLESNMTQKIPQKISEIQMLNTKQIKYGKIECTGCKQDLVEIELKEDLNNNNIINSNSNEFNDIIHIKDTKNKKKTFMIENHPVAQFFKNYQRYRTLSREIYSNEVIYNKLAKVSGRILKVRDDLFIKQRKGNKLNEGIYVMLIEAYKGIYLGSLWCLGLSGVFAKKSKKRKPFGELAVEKGFLGKYKFFYKEYKTEDVIDAYEYPFEIQLKGSKEKNDRLWKKDKYDYYYIIDPKILKEALKELERLSDTKIQKMLNQTISFSSINLKGLVKDLDFQQKVDERQKLMEKITNSSCLNCKNICEHFEQYEKFINISDRIEELKGELNPENLEHYREFNTRLNILQELNYVEEDNTLTIKGKAAREIGTTDCVLITELLTSDILTSLKDSEAVGFISGFASNKNEIELNEPNISRTFSDAVKKFTNIYNKIYEIEKAHEFEENKYNRRMTFEYSEAMINWMEGEDFLEIINLTELEEGKLYNLIMRIFLMLEEISNFYSELGNVEQSKRFLEIKGKLMRGIMALQSLYLQEKIDIDSVGKYS